MNSFFKLFLLLCLINSFLFSNDDVKSKELYLSYDSYPKRVFTGQKFDLTLKAIILKNENSYDKIVTTFTEENNIKILTQDIVWSKNKAGEFSATVTYKVQDTQFVLPTITVALLKDENIIDFISAESPIIKYQKIAINQKLFSNIIAKELKIHTVKTKQYNNTTLHTTIHIEGLNSNLEDIMLSEFEEQGVNSLTQEYPNESLYYYIMIPSHTKQINFTYYNTEINDFIMIQIPIILDEELVSTQTELNPYNSSILIYKQMFTAGVLLLGILLFIITKQNRYLLVVTLSIIILAYLFIPNKKILLEKDIKVYILPTKNSTVYKTLNSRHMVEVINEKENFIKVLFENNNIGWIKKNDIK